jgi:hypothetical protein
MSILVVKTSPGFLTITRIPHLILLILFFATSTIPYPVEERLEEYHAHGPIVERGSSSPPWHPETHIKRQATRHDCLQSLLGNEEK